ncbi:MAG: outer membrane beta-barrel protein [Candidatus Amulumruptor caecigallinarius]|nr:outer membrane beta-barrel protein [Candidatus Amulumruptor caecigallinarius]MCM1396258.1 outer membrane beta-barrel protein [Candidatus Amulumruptor caecigallinarius]MCM1454310.1 outer membrane beta-barrel protein [bacterium]
MKKVILAAAIMAAAMPAMAQEDFAPEAGDISLELQFNPFSDNFETFKMERLQGTYMFSEKDGLRFGLGLDLHNNKVTPSELNEDANTKNSYGSFSINLGYERHFYNYKRIDLYAGVEAVYTHRWAKQTINSEVGSGVTDPYTGNEIMIISTDEKFNYATDKDGKAFRGGNDFRFNLFTGINFSVYKGLYVGAELGLGLGFEHDSWQYDKINTPGVPEVETTKGNKGNSFDLEFYATPALRLGWTF